MLPSQEFFDRMKVICPDYDELVAAYSQPPLRGIRINPLKFTQDISVMNIYLTPVPFSPLGYLVNDDDMRLGRSPWHHAGAFYVQEPAAMSAVTALDPKPYERILDLCAAPGGKSTQIASLLGGNGLVWCNEYVRSRAQTLISNIERMGITNAVVSSLAADDLADELEGFFDRVLVDAPCSGEGMFRKDDAAVLEWSPAHVSACAHRQSVILDSAAKCVRSGGVLVYSTCTFAPEENELNIIAFLERHTDFHLEAIPTEFGRCGLDLSNVFDLTLTRRIYPMDGGEGHFVARLRREGNTAAEHSSANALAPVPSDAAELLNKCFVSPPNGNAKTVGDDIYLTPAFFPEYCSLPVMRSGILLGSRKKGRIEPAHALFMASSAQNCRNCIDLAPDSRELNAFLHGEVIPSNDAESGYCAVSCDGVITGFGKCSGGMIKNHYPKGLRILG